MTSAWLLGLSLVVAPALPLEEASIDALAAGLDRYLATRDPPPPVRSSARRRWAR
jgi:hypothetical protein